MASSKRAVACLRGQRTKLSQSINSELHCSRDLLQDGIPQGEDPASYTEDLTSQIGLLLKLDKKFEELTMRIAEGLEDEEGVEDVCEEDGSSSVDISVAVVKIISKLESRLKSMKRPEASPQGHPPTTPADNNAVQKQMDTILEIERLRAQGERDRRSSVLPHHGQIRLPKIEFSVFSGDIIKWPEFWDSFEAAVDRNVGLQPVEKLSYLRSKLDGEALTTIEGLQTTNENYEVAITLLKSRYGKTQLLITTHYTKMMDLPQVPNTTSKVRNIYDEMEKHLRCLDALGEDTTHRHFISLIMAKLPWEVVTKLEESKDEEEPWSVELLRKKLRSHLSAREAADRQCPDKGPNTSTTPKPYFGGRDTPRRGTTDALLVSDRGSTWNSEASTTTTKCVFCSGSHWSDECRKYGTLDSRKRAVKGRCFICLSDKHILKSCNNNRKPCWHCKALGNHHRSLCPKRFSSKTEATALASEDTRESADFGDTSHDSDHVEEVLLASGEKVLLQTALCTITTVDGSNSVRTRILLDSGSHRSYISERLATRLKVQRGISEAISVVTFGAERPKTVQTKSTEIALTTKDGSVKTISVNIVPKITGSISRSPTSFDQTHFLWKDLPLADTLPKELQQTSIDCLLGSDYYLDFVTAEKIQVRDGLYLLGSKFGWILTGRTGEEATGVNMAMFVNSYVNSSVPQLSFGSSLDSCLPVCPNLEDFWSLEAIGVKDPVDRSDDQRAVESFQQKIACENGRYYVSWPWKQDISELPENFELSLGRFKSTCKRLSRDDDLLQKYDLIIRDQEQKGVIEKVKKNDDNVETVKHYIPHHPVITPKKVRIVYDASAKCQKSDKSLNECLLRGPVILQNLCGLLLRFRLHEIVLLADIEKAFLQVGLHEEDRDVTRFFWLKDAKNANPDRNTQIFRFCRVPFGVISSPFLLAATVKHHLENSASPLADKLCRNIYVDNIVTGVSDVQTALKFYSESKILFNQASMNLREWSSNSKEFLATLPSEDTVEATSVKVLGLKWNSTTDQLYLATCDDGRNFRAISKREVVKEMARTFDPLGFFVPVTLNTKLFVQELWEKQPDWDSPLSKEDEERWYVMSNELRQLTSIKIDRYFSVTSSGTLRILCFCDASFNAYATAVYLQYQSGTEWKARLVFAKSRVSPPKRKLTIPRLELMAVLIGIRCIKFIESELDMKISDKILWTDSKCVLHWIKSIKPLSVFVENRVKEIRSHADVEFRYVKTTDNPADIATKVHTTMDLAKNMLWWEGPPWLKRDSSEWPSWEFQKFSSEDILAFNKEMKGSKVLFEAGLIADTSLSNPPFGIDESRFSSLTRLLRVTAWIVRFLRNIGMNGSAIGMFQGCFPETNTLSAKELVNSRQLWERHVQHLHFKEVLLDMKRRGQNNLQRQLGLQLDDAGILRCHGRYANADVPEDTKFPKLLPRASHFTALVIESVHRRLLHSGVSHTLSTVRQEYWISQGRSQVKTILSRCLVCRKHEGGPFKTPPMPPLPSFRTNPSPPFSYTGVDYFGPLYVKKPGTEATKVWICLFTCLCVRAIHLELVGALSGEEFLMGLRRFVARRGLPIQFISDNAPQFKVANFTLKRMFHHKIEEDGFDSLLSNQGASWKFIPEFAPWMGGFYERLVGVVKRALRKSIGTVCLTFTQLATVLVEVESVVNSRPLVYVDNDLETGPAISPAMFLSLNPRRRLPQADISELDDPNYYPQSSTASALRESWTKGQNLLHTFWDSWQTDYLLSLRESHKSSLKSPRVTSTSFPKVGQTVLIRDAATPRSTWKMGAIVRLIPSSDNMVRSVRIILPNGKVIVRPIRNLYPLECADSDSVRNVDIPPFPRNVIPSSGGTHQTSDSKWSGDHLSSQALNKGSSSSTPYVPVAPLIDGFYHAATPKATQPPSSISVPIQPPTDGVTSTKVPRRKAFLAAKESLKELLKENEAE